MNLNIQIQRLLPVSILALIATTAAVLLPNTANAKQTEPSEDIYVYSERKKDTDEKWQYNTDYLYSRPQAERNDLPHTQHSGASNSQTETTNSGTTDPGQKTDPPKREDIDTKCKAEKDAVEKAAEDLETANKQLSNLDKQIDQITQALLDQYDFGNFTPVLDDENQEVTGWYWTLKNSRGISAQDIKTINEALDQAVELLNQRAQLYQDLNVGRLSSIYRSWQKELDNCLKGDISGIS